MRTGILVSGGDAPGINAAIDAFMTIADAHGDRVIGAHGGFAGLLAGALVDFDRGLVSLLSGRGGSILRSSREMALAAPGARDKLRTVMNERGIDNLLLFGGDGSIRHILPLLQRWGVACVVLPTTIDNDVPGTGYTLGHDSACNYAWQSISGIRATAHALPGRIFLVETLGGFCGRLALEIAYAANADAVLLPEYAFELDWLAARCIKAVKARGTALVIVCEGVQGSGDLAETLASESGIRVRQTGLGHAQRGADVSFRDRVAAREMSLVAHQAFRDGVRLGMAVERDGKFSLQAGLPAMESLPPPDAARYKQVNGL